MVGGDDYATRPFNLATQGQRQPGSSFKPFILAEALTQGISPDSTWASRKIDLCVAKTKKGRCKESFNVNNYEDAYAGVQTLRTRDDVLRQLRLRPGRRPGRDAEDRRPRAPDGHPHAGLEEPRDDARRPARGRHAARHGARVPDARPARPLHLHDDEPGRGRALQARSARPRPGRASSRSATATTASSSPSSCPTARRPSAGRESWPVLKTSVADQVSSILSTVVTQGTAVARADPGHVRRRQDGHDGELRRRLVRRLDRRDHGRGLGRLPGRAAPDGDRVPRPARRRRHLPGEHLADVRRARRSTYEEYGTKDEDDEDPTLPPGTTAPATPAVPGGRRDGPRPPCRTRARPTGDGGAAPAPDAAPQPEPQQQAPAPEPTEPAPATPRRPPSSPPRAATAAAPPRRPASGSEAGRPRPRDAREPARAEAPRQLGRLGDPDPRPGDDRRRPPSPAGAGRSASARARGRSR